MEGCDGGEKDEPTPVDAGTKPTSGAKDVHVRKVSRRENMLSTGKLSTQAGHDEAACI